MGGRRCFSLSANPYLLGKPERHIAALAQLADAVDGTAVQRAHAAPVEAGEGFEHIVGGNPDELAGGGDDGHGSVEDVAGTVVGSERVARGRKLVGCEQAGLSGLRVAGAQLGDQVA